MILTSLENLTAYRMHVPKWAVAPTSGAGAARAGGRANRIGVPALYLALEVTTAVAEYQQLSPLMPPGTLVSYRVTTAPIVDFTGGYHADRWPPLWESFFCDWRRDWFNARIEPPSWVLGDEVIAAGAKGILFRSTQHTGGTNLVLFVDQLDEGDRLDVNDPAGALPRNQASWDGSVNVPAMESFSGIRDAVQPAEPELDVKSFHELEAHVRRLETERPDQMVQVLAVSPWNIFGVREPHALVAVRLLRGGAGPELWVTLEDAKFDSVFELRWSSYDMELVTHRMLRDERRSPVEFVDNR